LVLPALAGAWCSASAATYKVVVIGADGRPASDTVVLLQPAGRPAAAAAPPAEPVLIVQKDIRFQPYVTVLAPGSTVRFINRDSFDHHVRSQAGGPLGSVPPVKDFEFRLAAFKGGGKEASADLEFENEGSVVLGCHIHGSMRGHILVSAVPFRAVTDAAGAAVLEGLPDGAAEVRLWHPDQLTEQAPQRVTLAGTVAADLKLNFTPRRRTPPRRSDYDN
jgi:plastocyanin